jgi:hypothetical protein
MLNLALSKEIGEFLVRSDLERFFSPKIWGKVSVGLCQSSENSLDEVTHGTGVTTCRGVAVINPSHVQQLFWNRSSDKSSTARSRDQTHTNGTTLSRQLARDGVWKPLNPSPVSTAKKVAESGDQRQITFENNNPGGKRPM